MHDSSPITLSNEGLSGTTEVETTKASSERVERGTPLSLSKGERETELRNSFFPFKFQWLQHDICQCWLHQGSLEARSSTLILQKRKQGQQFLTETHINNDKIHQIINHWLGPIFLAPRNIHAKGMLGQLHPSLEGITEVDTKREICVLQEYSL